MERLRKWLEGNKVLFETLAAILLSVMAISLSWQANRISRAQMVLAERQTALLEQESQPFFRTELHVRWDTLAQRLDDDQLTVVNDGAPAYNPQARLVEFLALRCPEAARDSLIPMEGYFDAALLTGRRTDTLLTFTGRGNRSRLFALYRAHLRLVEGQGQPGWEGHQMFLRLNYLDRTGRAQTRYFAIREPGGAALIDSTTGAAMIAKYDSLWMTRRVNLYTATHDSIPIVCH